MSAICLRPANGVARRPPATTTAPSPPPPPSTRARVRTAATARRNDTSKGPRHETRWSAANARSRRRERPAPGLKGDPLVPAELLREAQGTEGERGGS